MPKRLLNLEEKNRYLEKYINGKYNRGYIRNPEKAKLFNDIINSNFLKRKGNESRITAFNRQWRKAQRIARTVFGSKNISERSKIAADFVRENTYYRSSILNNFHSKKGIDAEESFRDAETKTYLARIEKFLEKYGDSKLSGDVIGIHSEMTMNEFVELFKNGSIDKDTMNEIIKYFKTGTEYYQKQVGSD